MSNVNLPGWMDKPTGPCQRCKTNPATSWWSEGTIALIRGMKEGYCERCCVELQLAHALELAKRIDSLSQRLNDLGGPMERDSRE